jgi:hypothetical protein
MTDENEREATIDFSFLPKGEKFVATIYADAKDASWDKNPQNYTIEKVLISSETILDKFIARGGGLAISIKEATENDLNQLDSE